MIKIFIFMFLLSVGQLTAQVRPAVITRPADKSVFSPGQSPVFTWQFPEPGAMYKIKIVEILGDQSPEVALRSNKPHFEKDSLKEQAFKYPVSAILFVSGKKYAWNVQALTRDGKPIGQNNGTSPAAQFSLGPAIKK